MNLIPKYVISVQENKLSRFKQYMAEYNIDNFIKLPCELTPGRHWIGAGLSHKDCVKHAMDNNYDYAMVFEDDARFIPDIDLSISAIVEELINYDDWEYACISNTLLYKIDKRNKHIPNIDILDNNNIQLKRKTTNTVQIDINNTPGPVIGNCSCVIYNKKCYDKYISTFDPYKDEWCDVWAPKNLKTLLVSPPLVYQFDKKWMLGHCEIWGRYLQNL